MLNLVKMEWYKLRTTKLFIVLMAIGFALNVIICAVIPIVVKLVAPNEPAALSAISGSIASPFAGLLMIMVYISAVSFMYSDFAGGYIKNIAGQVKNRGSIVIAKLIVVAIHNLIFFAVGSIGNVLGSALGGSLVVDSEIAGGVFTFLLRWLLSIAICSVLMLFAVGIKTKSFAIVMAVIFATGSLNLLYLGVNTAIMTIFKTEVNVGNLFPDTLMGSVDAITNTNVINAVLVSAVFIVLFTVLTYVIFKKRDVK